MEHLTEAFAYLLPALVVGAIAWLFFRMFFRNEESRRRHLLKRDTLKESLGYRVEAYQRMVLFIERMDLNSLVGRVKPYNAERADYVRLLIKTIEQEWQHNLTQQIYISADTWNVIKIAKCRTQGLLTQIASTLEDQSMEAYQQALVEYNAENEGLPSDTAMSYLKEEVGRIL